MTLIAKQTFDEIYDKLIISNQPFINIIDKLEEALLEQKENILKRYNATLSKEHAFELRDYYLYGIHMNSLIDIFYSGNYTNIKNILLAAGISQSMHSWDDRTYKDRLKNIYMDIFQLEKVDYDSIEAYMIDLHNSLNKIFTDFKTINPKNHLPYILNAGYGIESGLAKLYGGIDNDTDNDGIDDKDEVKVLFRSSLDHNDYTKGWVAIYDKNHDPEGELIKCDYYETKKTKNRPLYFGIHVRNGLTPEKYPYLIVKELDPIVYIVCIKKENSYAIYRHDTTNPNSDSNSYLYSILPSFRYWNNEVKLCPGANPISQDIFVEVDWMGSPSYECDMEWWESLIPFYGLIRAGEEVGKLIETWHDHEMSTSAKDKVIDAFEKHYIKLHIDAGSMGGGGPITHKDPVTGSTDELSSDGEEWLYDHEFANERNDIFHYCIICHHIKGTESRGHGESPGDEFTLAGARISGTDAWCHVFIHELGHNILGTINADHRSAHNDDHCSHEDCVMFEGVTWWSWPNPTRSWDSEWNLCSDCWKEVDLAQSF